MRAYGENSHSRWARNRRIAYCLWSVLLTARSLHRLDPQNVDHLFMRFYVEGENGKATVRLEMTKVLTLKYLNSYQGEHESQYKYRFMFVEFDPCILFPQVTF